MLTLTQTQRPIYCNINKNLLNATGKYWNTVKVAACQYLKIVDAKSSSYFFCF